MNVNLKSPSPPAPWLLVLVLAFCSRSSSTRRDVIADSKSTGNPHRDANHPPSRQIRSPMLRLVDLGSWLDSVVQTVLSDGSNRALQPLASTIRNNSLISKDFRTTPPPKERRHVGKCVNHDSLCKTL
ncbi:hypothetical protein HOY80DRAFT_989679, partial [Tuber brumale]